MLLRLLAASPPEPPRSHRPRLAAGRDLANVLTVLRLSELGFASPSLQVAVAGPRGKTYWLDFGLDESNAWGEFDGKVKYRELAAASGRSSREVVEAEKRREDWIRGTTKQDIHIADRADDPAIAFCAIDVLRTYLCVPDKGDL